MERRTFRLFPGAAVTTRKIWLAILAVSAVAALSAAAGVTHDNAYQTQEAICARVQCGILWLMATTLLVARWYRVPVHPFHNLVLTSFSAYLSVFLSFLVLLTVYGLSWLAVYQWVDGFAYLSAVSCWAYGAWRPETTTATAHVTTLRRVEYRLSGGLAAARHPWE